MKRFAIDLIMAAGILLSLFMGSFRGFAEECEDIRTEVLRLHIPANSDSEYDQRLKLELRDLLLSEFGGQLADSDDLEAARERAEQLLPEIERVCYDFLAERGADYSAKAELTEMYFATRVYGNVTLPAGTYDALRITLGSGEGENWWCVMFPPLCIPAASEQAEAYLPDVLLSEKQGGMEVKFALFEFFRWILGE